MGRGRLSLKGRNKVPWLEIERCETERTYLDHQLRTLRKLNHGELCQGELQLVPSEGFYDRLRLRFQARPLYRVWDLLYPRDQRRISPEALQVAGPLGAACLWLDNGRWLSKTTGCIKGLSSLEDTLTVAEWLSDMNVPCRYDVLNGDHAQVLLGVTGMQQFVKLTRPLTHVSMRHKLKPPKKDP